MKKKFYGALLLGSVLLAGGMVSCSDYDDDINSLNDRVTAVEQTVKELQEKIQQMICHISQSVFKVLSFINHMPDDTPPDVARCPSSLILRL